MNILLGALPDQVKFLFNNRITELVETADALHVTFAQGAPRAFELVFGCDGLHSSVRHSGLGPKRRTRAFCSTTPRSPSSTACC